MKELIKIEMNDNQEPIVGGRELHEALGIETRYSDWFKRMCEYGFVENQDYVLVTQKRVTNNPRNPYTEVINHAIKLDMAKEIAMIQRNEKGKEVRHYFIQVEKEYNSPERIMARALRVANEELKKLTVDVNKLQLEIKEQKPKVIFADAVDTSRTSILIGDLAKLIQQNGFNIGQNRLFEWLRDNNYLIKSGERRNMPTQKSMELGLFEVKERSVINPNGSNRLTRTTKVTGKGQIYFINKFIMLNGEKFKTVY